MSDTVIMIDLVGSTQAMANVGLPVAGLEIAERLRSLVQRFAVADPTIRQVGEFSGDGVLLVGSNPKEAIICAVREQAVWAGMAARIAVCIGPVEFREGAGAQGGAINLASRLVHLCAPGSVVVSESAVDYLLDVPGIRRRMVHQRVQLKGLGEVTYWTMDGRAGHRGARYQLIAVSVLLVIALVSLAYHHHVFVKRMETVSIAFFEAERPMTFADGEGAERRSVFAPGETVWVRRNFCVTRPIRFVAHRFLINGEVIHLPSRTRDLQVGCTSGVLPIPLPVTITPGAWTSRVILEVVGGETKQLTDSPFTVQRR